MSMPRFLEVDDLDPVRLDRILDRASAWKRDPESVPRPLAAKGAALVFEKPSARTRSSTEMAVFTLGGHPIYIRGEEVGIGSREDFYWTLHAVFVNRRDQREVFDQAFHVFWRNPRLLERLMQAGLPQVLVPPAEEDRRELSRRVADAVKSPGEGAKMKLWGFEFLANRPAPWVAAAILIGAGVALARQAWPRMAEAWNWSINPLAGMGPK